MNSPAYRMKSATTKKSIPGLMRSKSSMPDLGLVRRSRFICDTMGGAAVGRRSGAGGAGAAKAVAAVQWWVVARWRARCVVRAGTEIPPRHALVARPRIAATGRCAAVRCAGSGERAAPAAVGRGAVRESEARACSRRGGALPKSYRGGSCRPPTKFLSRQLMSAMHKLAPALPPAPVFALAATMCQNCDAHQRITHQRTLQQFSVAQTGCGDT